MLDLLPVMRCLGFWASFWASFRATFIMHTQFFAETIEHVWCFNDIFIWGVGMGNPPYRPFVPDNKFPVSFL